MGNTVPVIPSQHLEDESNQANRLGDNSKNCQKIETSQSMGHITNCPSSTKGPQKSNQMPHSNTFHHQQQKDAHSSNNFLLNHFLNYSLRSSKKRSSSQQNESTNRGAPAERQLCAREKASTKDARKNSIKIREARTSNEQQLLNQIEKQQQSGDSNGAHKKSLSCFNFNQSLNTKPVSICAPSANDYENANHKLGKDFYTKFSTLNIKSEESSSHDNEQSSSKADNASLSRSAQADTACQGLKLSKSSSAISRTVTITASTSELLKCLAIYLSIKCRKLAHFHGNEVILWLRTIDRSLLVQGWQDIAFISPANVVFVYLLLRDYISDKIKNVDELQAIVLTCLYLSYSYVGNEISYPLKPFLVESDRRVFWSRCVGIINESSAKMLLINQDPAYFTHIFTELKQYGEKGKPDN
ncbi:uncharacterized protein LOC142340057 [Convolutriloba macropyga]|uniref:uncharacterized protein LOC142340057 n=1 Tax=Convolutriloba macropyga TaxID=536237 RepID=UPI003F51BBB4